MPTVKELLPQLDHVAILVESLESTLNNLSLPKDLIGDISSFPSEGTREVYVGGTHARSRLLLIQANGEGPYQRAMEKRGAGLHHVAITVPDMEAYLSHLSGSGWYLHPISLSSWKEVDTVWVTRPGMPFLVELIQRRQNHLESDKPFIVGVGLPSEGRSDLIAILSVAELTATESEPHLTFLNRPTSVLSLLR